MSKNYQKSKINSTDKNMYDPENKNSQKSESIQNEEFLRMIVRQSLKPKYQADIGSYCKLKKYPKYYVKKYSTQQLSKVIKIKSQQNKHYVAKQLLTTQFKSVSKISDQIQQYLQIVRNSHKTQQISFHNVKNARQNLQKKKYLTSKLKNIKQNYLLKYYYKFYDKQQGYFLLHQPIIITLQELIIKNQLVYKQKVELFAEIIKMVQFLEELKLCHRNICPTNIVIVSRDKQKPIQLNNVKDFRFNKLVHAVRINGFYQSVYVNTQSQQKDKEYPNIIIQNKYTDPHILSFKEPKFISDLWSVGLVFYQMLNGKITNFNDKQEMQYSLNNLVSYHRDFFTYVFKGTRHVNFQIRDFKIRVKNMLLTCDVTDKLMKQKQNNQINLEIQNNNNNKSWALSYSNYKQLQKNNSAISGRKKRLLSCQVNQLEYQI